MLAWVLAVAVGLHYLDTAWSVRGHITCDFACQWLMGRMYFNHDAHELYVIGVQKAALREGYQGDALEKMVRDILLKGPSQADDAIEGPLYPPTHGLLMFPFARLEPRAAHAVLTLIYVQLVFLSGLFIRDITGGRLQMGEAALICMVFPNFSGGITLGQNSSLTLAIVSGGWCLWSRQRPLLAGLVWGLLAYKPVFAAALIWVPMVLWSGRFLLGMIVSGTGFCLATLPFCGVAPWVRWLQVGKNAAEIYATDRNWIWMSRDLLGLPRREMWDWEHLRNHLELVTAQRTWDYELLQTVHPGPLAGYIGHALLAGVLSLTIITTMLVGWIGRRRGLPRDPMTWGPLPAFVLFGALLTVYHFMHYDMQPLALPMCLLLAALPMLNWPSRTGLLALNIALVYSHLDLGIGHGSTRIPFETFLVLLAWAWSGCLALSSVLTQTQPQFLNLDTPVASQAPLPSNERAISSSTMQHPSPH